jgi:hypothetical protein
VVEWILRGGVPAISTASDVIDPRLPTVCTATDSIAKLAANHLLECGCGTANQ